VDGLVTFTMDANAEVVVARELGIPSLSFFSRVGYGGGAACATVQQAAMTVATDMASVVVCYRAFNERSGSRFGPGADGRGGAHVERAGQQLAEGLGPRPADHAGGAPVVPVNRGAAALT
jgi:acetyl-CoA acetyltransferase